MIYYNYQTKKWNCNGKVFDNVHDAMSEEVKGQKKTRKRKSVKLYHERDGNTYRSTWEIIVADAMYEAGIEYFYEPKRFKFYKEKESYLPDFYIPEYEGYLEIKGWYDERSRKRTRLFKKYHPEIPYCMFLKDEIDILKKDPTAITWMLKQYFGLKDDETGKDK